MCGKDRRGGGERKRERVESVYACVTDNRRERERECAEENEKEREREGEKEF